MILIYSLAYSGWHMFTHFTKYNSRWRCHLKEEPQLNHQHPAATAPSTTPARALNFQTQYWILKIWKYSRSFLSCSGVYGDIHYRSHSPIFNNMCIVFVFFRLYSVVQSSYQRLKVYSLFLASSFYVINKQISMYKS